MCSEELGKSLPTNAHTYRLYLVNDQLAKDSEEPSNLHSAAISEALDYCTPQKDLSTFVAIGILRRRLPAGYLA